MMRNLLIWIGLFSIAALWQDKNTLAPLFALEGTWAREKENKILYESWHRSAEHVLQGKSYTLSGADTILVETMILENRKGSLVFTAIDAGHKEQGPTSFTLTRIVQNGYYFENPAHDYPRRVIYELPGRDSLHAWIDGGEKEKDSRVDFYFRRVR